MKQPLPQTFRKPYSISLADQWALSSPEKKANNPEQFQAILNIPSTETDKDACGYAARCPDTNLT
jgi:hypothetical protein